ncbi:MAG: alpha/beta fold hydrolase [bacterium]
MKRKSKLRLFSLLLIVCALALTAFFYVTTFGLQSKATPTTTYDDALFRLSLLEQADSPQILEKCKTTFLTHGKKTDRMVVLIHGFTNCPQQYRAFGQQLYDQGYNVLIPRIPHHGFADLMTNEPQLLTAGELRVFSDEVVDIATGLGEKVTVSGISAGGVMAAWVAQNRADVDKIVVLAPVFGSQTIPVPLKKFFVNASIFFPGYYRWWDEVKKQEDGLDHAYPRFSTRAVAEIARLGYAVHNQATQSAPLSKSITVITLEDDPAVNNEMTSDMVALWRGKGKEVETFQFSKDLGLIHDMLDPDQKKQQIGVVYPVLLGYFR